MPIRALAAVLAALAVAVPAAQAQPYLPAKGKIRNGVTGNVRPVSRFIDQTGKHPAVWQFFLWGSDNPAFVHELFRWVRSHKRVRMLTCNQGNRAGGPFALKLYPKGRNAIVQELRSPLFPAFAPELAR